MLRTPNLIIKKMYAVLPIVDVNRDLPVDQIRSSLEYTVNGLKVEEYYFQKKTLKLFADQKDAESEAAKNKFATLESPVVEICVVADSDDKHANADAKGGVVVFDYTHANFFVTGKCWLPGLDNRWHPPKPDAKQEDEETIKNNAYNRFHHYANPSKCERLFSWRHHRALAGKIATELQKKSPIDALEYLIKQRIDICNAFQKKNENGGIVPLIKPSSFNQYGLQNLLTGTFMQDLEKSIRELQQVLEPKMSELVNEKALARVVLKN